MEDIKTEYTLTEDEKGMVFPLIETIESLQKDATAILRGISRLRNLEGNWNLQGDKMIKSNGTGATSQG